MCILHLFLELSWPRWSRSRVLRFYWWCNDTTLWRCIENDLDFKICAQGSHTCVYSLHTIESSWICGSGSRLIDVSFAAFLFCSVRGSSANACQEPDNLSSRGVTRSTCRVVVCLSRWYLWHGTSSSAAYNICMCDPWCYEVDWILTSWWLALTRNSLVKISIPVIFWVSEMVRTTFQVHGANDGVIYSDIQSGFTYIDLFYRWCGGIMNHARESVVSTIACFGPKHHTLPKRNLFFASFWWRELLGTQTTWWMRWHGWCSRGILPDAFLWSISITQL